MKFVIKTGFSDNMETNEGREKRFFILNTAAWPLQNTDDGLSPDPDEEHIYFF